MDIHSLLISEDFKDAWKDIHYLLHRMEKDLASYAGKEGANQTTVNIKNETIKRVKKFVEAAGALVEEQAEMLEKTNGLHRKHKKLNEDYFILHRYAKSKGLDVTLLDYMTVKDFN
jgi:hypothetical protein